MPVTPQAPVECPACHGEFGVTRAGRIVLHKGDEQQRRGDRDWCSGAMKQVAEASVWMPDTDTMEAMARLTEAKAKKAWIFIHQAEPPEEFSRGIRALIAVGADQVTISGAITIAALKRDLPYVDQWRYACGVVRNELLRRPAVSDA